MDGQSDNIYIYIGGRPVRKLHNTNRRAFILHLLNVRTEGGINNTERQLSDNLIRRVDEFTVSQTIRTDGLIIIHSNGWTRPEWKF